MAVAETGGTAARQGARIPSVRSVVQLLLLTCGVVAGVRAALPIADVRTLCPAAGEAGHLACLLDKAWLPAVLKAVLIVAATHAGGALVLWTLPGAVRHRVDRRARTRRMHRRRGDRPAVVERRAAPRAQVRLRVLVRRDAGALPIGDVRTRDASVSGLLLDPVTDVRVGEAIWLTVHLGPGRILETGGRVTRRTRDGAVGVAFEGLGAVDRGRLASCVATAR